MTDNKHFFTGDYIQIVPHPEIKSRFPEDFQLGYVLSSSIKDSWEVRWSSTICVKYSAQDAQYFMLHPLNHRRRQIEENIESLRDDIDQLNIQLEELARATG